MEINTKSEKAEEHEKKKENTSIKLKAVFALNKPVAGQWQKAVEGVELQTVENLWDRPRHQREKWKDILEENLCDSEPSPLDEQLVNSLLTGSTLYTKALERKILRVFISSTFTDTAQERNVLIADVYPYLKLFGRKYGFEFTPSEMRWGIREQSSSDHMTSMICMAEIKRCQEESQGISYIALLGDKYGFRPFPAQIDSSEFESLLDQARMDNSPHVNLVQDWFEMNSNMVPPMYVLKSSTHAPEGEWWGIFENIQMTLRKASVCLPDKERAKWYTASVTEMEVRCGLLNVENRNQTAFCYRRKIPDVEKHISDDAAAKFVDRQYSDGQVDIGAQVLLHSLKNDAVPSALSKNNIMDYTVPWGPGISLDMHADYLREFSDHFCELMLQSMSEAIKRSHVVVDGMFEEVRNHALFCMDKARHVSARDDILEKINAYLSSSSSFPLVVWGPSGAGKTSVMAKAISNTIHEKPSGAVVLYRFLGNSMQSTSGRPLLRSLCEQLCRVFDKGVEDVPSDYKNLVEQFPKYLEFASSEKPIVLFMDSLDQLSDEDNARNLEWMPFSLPAHVKVVLSTLPNVGGCLKKLQQSLTQETFIEVTTLAVQDGRRILEFWLNAKNRSLTESQMSEVLNAFKECPFPLFLKIAFETSCNWASFTPDREIALSRSVRGLIDDMFDRLCRIHGNVLVSHALGYLTVTRFGLTAAELEDILSCDDEVLNDVYQWWVPPVRRIPPLLWVRIKTDLGPYLIERGVDGGTPVLSWYHRQFREAAEERFVPSVSVRESLLSIVADYFLGRWAGQSLPYIEKNGVSKTADRKLAAQPLIVNERSSSSGKSKCRRKYNARKLVELPSALIGAGRWRAFTESVCNIAFIEAKSVAGLVFELVSETSMAAKLAKQSGNSEVNKIQEFALLIKQNAAMLNKYPASTLQQAANFPDISAPAIEAKKYLASETNAPHWLRYVNKPQVLSAKLMTLAWDDPSESECAAFSPDARFLCCGTCKESGTTYHLRIWDIETGLLLMKVASENKSYRHVMYSPFDSTIICAMSDSIRILDRQTGATVKECFTDPNMNWKTFERELVDMSLSVDGLHLATAYQNGDIIIWSMEDGSMLKHKASPNKMDSDVKRVGRKTLVRYTKNGRYLCHATYEFIVMYEVNDDYRELTVIKLQGRSSRITPRSVQVPSGIFAMTCAMDSHPGENEQIKPPLTFLENGGVEGRGNGKGGDFDIEGEFNVSTHKVKFVQTYWINRLYTPSTKWEYEGELEFTPDSEEQDGSCHIWGRCNMSTSGVTLAEDLDVTQAGDFDIILTKSELGDEYGSYDVEIPYVTGGDVSGDSRFMVTSNADGTLNIFSLTGPMQGECDRNLPRMAPRFLKIYTWIRHSMSDYSLNGDARFHPQDSSRVYHSGLDGCVRCYNIYTHQVVSSYPLGNHASLAISNDGSLLASMIRKHETSVIVVYKRTLVVQKDYYVSFPGICCTKGPAGFVIVGNTKHKATTSGIKNIRNYNFARLSSTEIWDASQADFGAKQMANEVSRAIFKDVGELQFSHDGTKLAVLVASEVSRIVETESGEILTDIRSRDIAPFGSTACAFSPDDTVIVISADHIQVHDVADGSFICQIDKDLNFNIETICFSPTGTEIVVFGDDSDSLSFQASIQCIEYPDGKWLEERITPPNDTFDGCVSRIMKWGGSKLYVAIMSDDRKEVGEYDLTTGEEMRTFPSPDENNDHNFVDISEGRLIQGGFNGEITVHNLDSGALLVHTELQAWNIKAIFGVHFKEDDFLVCGFGDRMLYVVDVNTGELRACMETLQPIVRATMTTISKENAPPVTYIAYGDFGSNVGILQLVEH